MSWTVGLPKPVPKEEFAAAVDALQLADVYKQMPTYDAMCAQLAAAKQAVKALAQTLSSMQLIGVNLNGHVGDAGYAASSINVNVYEANPEQVAA